ncbi:MAG: hypothetical protein V8R49_06170 [Duodenibacillus massiliensis]
MSKDMDDALTVTLGGNYDFQIKVYFGGQYFTNAKKVGQKNVSATSTMDKGYDFESPTTVLTASASASVSAFLSWAVPSVLMPAT